MQTKCLNLPCCVFLTISNAHGPLENEITKQPIHTVIIGAHLCIHYLEICSSCSTTMISCKLDILIPVNWIFSYLITTEFL